MSATGRAVLDLRGIDTRTVVARLDNTRALPDRVLVEVLVDHRTPWNPTVEVALSEVARRLLWTVVADLSDHRNATTITVWVWRLRAATEGHR